MGDRIENIEFGKRFGRLLVLADAGVDYNRKRQVLVHCDCGTLKIIRWSRINQPDSLDASPKHRPSRSCGCESSKAFQKNVQEFIRRIPKKIKQKMWKEFQSGSTIKEITARYGRNQYANRYAISQVHKEWQEKHPKASEPKSSAVRADVKQERGQGVPQKPTSDSEFAHLLEATEDVRQSIDSILKVQEGLPQFVEQGSDKALLEPPPYRVPAEPQDLAEPLNFGLGSEQAFPAGLTEFSQTAEPWEPREPSDFVAYPEPNENYTCPWEAEPPPRRQFEQPKRITSKRQNQDEVPF